MSNLENNFSVLQIDVEGDNIQPVKGENKQPIKHVSSQKQICGENSGPKNLDLENGKSEGFKLPLVWIDLEMTGLDFKVDRILEIACIITNGSLNKSIEGPDLVVRQSKECLDKMGEWCKEHHASSGLTERVLRSTITEQDAENQVIAFVKEHIGSYTPHLAGNSVYMDFLFLKEYMPSLADMFSHVVVDVSSITALSIRWFPKAKKKAPKKEKKHRAMEDIRESIRELKYYKETIFKGPIGGNKSSR